MSLHVDEELEGSAGRSPRAQVEAAHAGALAIPHGELAALEVRGGDRATWLNGVLYVRPSRSGPEGTARYGLAVGRSGRVLADVLLVADAERVLLAVPASAREALEQHFNHYLVMEDAEVAHAPLGVWSIHGPGAADALAAAVAAGAVGGSLDRTGLGGAVLFVPGEVARAALASQATVGDAAGWEALRLERAVPRFGADFGEATYPQEARLEATAVSFDKGCYLGQEVVCMLELRGHVKRMLVPLVLDGAEPPAPGAPVTDASGAVVGEITSAAASPSLGKPIALAMIKRASAEVGRRLVAAGVSAEVVARPA